MKKRAKKSTYSTSAAVAAGIEALPESEHLQMFEQCVYQAYGEQLSVECVSLLEFERARVSLLVLEASMIEASVTLPELSSMEMLASACEAVVPGSSRCLEVSKVAAERDVLVRAQDGTTYTSYSEEQEGAGREPL